MQKLIPIIALSAHPYTASIAPRASSAHVQVAAVLRRSAARSGPRPASPRAAPWRET